MKTTTEIESYKCKLLNSSYVPSDHGDSCPPSYDGAMCWNTTDAGSSAYMECPFNLCPACNITFADRAAARECLPSGAWNDTDYSKCRDIYFNARHCIESPCHRERCLDDFRVALGILTLVLSLISAVCLIISLSIFSSFQSIQCRRLTIHKHLALAFIIRFIIMTIWILTQIYHVFQPCSGVPYGWLCKTILFLLMYSTMASMFWMFVEGAYLASRFTVLAMRSSEGHIAMYIAVGWVLPFLFVSSWGVCLELQPHLKYSCWLPYSNNRFILLLVGPLAVALGFNVFFLLIVIAILVKKLKDPNTSTMESATIWKAIKATLLLVPLLGVSNLLLFLEPNPQNQQLHKVYMVFATILQNSQGVFVAVLYCFCNTEVQEAFHRRLKKWPLYYRYWEKKSSKTYTTVTQSEADPDRIRVVRKSPERQMMIQEGGVQVFVEPNDNEKIVKICN